MSSSDALMDPVFLHGCEGVRCGHTGQDCRKTSETVTPWKRKRGLCLLERWRGRVLRGLGGAGSRRETGLPLSFKQKSRF